MFIVCRINKTHHFLEHVSQFFVIGELPQLSGTVLVNPITVVCFVKALDPTCLLFEVVLTENAQSEFCPLLDGLTDKSQKRCRLAVELTSSTDFSRSPSTMKTRRLF